MADHLGLLRFDEGYFERIWGGRKLETLFGKALPPGAPVGEAWLISDHPEYESRVVEGPQKGRSLRDLMVAEGPRLLGTRAKPTPFGRFPLLLKLLDAVEVLSVQVHPDDATALRLGEPDAGKTEMWRVFQADPDAVLYCGLEPGVTPERFLAGVKDNTLDRLVRRFPARAGMSIFVNAGTVHAIGAGLVIAEIQQNSNLTYRSYDWGRVDAAGKPRELHIEKSLAATSFDDGHTGPAVPLGYDVPGGRIGVLAACPYFAAHEITVRGRVERDTRSESFHMLLAGTGSAKVQAGQSATTLRPGEATLVPAVEGVYTLEGEATVLEYHVPCVETDILAPLAAAGYSRDAIARIQGLDTAGAGKK